MSNLYEIKNDLRGLLKDGSNLKAEAVTMLETLGFTRKSEPETKSEAETGELSATVVRPSSEISNPLVRDAEKRAQNRQASDSASKAEIEARQKIALDYLQNKKQKGE